MYENSTIVISAWNRKEVVGAIRALTDKLVTGVIFSLVVKSKYQKQSIGTKLIKKCIVTYPGLIWYLKARNSKVEKWYEKLGFKQEKKHWFKK